MKEYKIQLDDSRELFNSQGEETSELDIILQVWQDLNKLSAGGMHIEDEIIKKTLEQVLLQEYGRLPEGYEVVQQKITTEQAKAMLRGR